MATRRKKRRRNPLGIYMAIAVVALVIAIGAIIAAKRYTPTSEHMDLSLYFRLIEDNQAAVIFNGEYNEVDPGASKVDAIYQDGVVYLEYDFVKKNLDDGFVYDPSEITLRYATANEVYTTTLGSSDYLIDKSNNNLGHNIVVAQDDTVYIAIDYVQLQADFQYSYHEAPNRVVIETAGWEKEVATLKAKTQARTHGGVKSPVLEDTVKGEKVIRLENYGKWSLVLTENAVLGCVRNNKLSEITVEYTAQMYQPRNYNHISIGPDVSLAWHQVTAQAANADIANVLSETGKINVISPTWFYLNNNSGGIASLASKDYVSYCHANNIQVWALVSNLEDDSVDTTKVLNTTSSRDNLVNNLIAQAITYSLDGINVDIEELSGNAKDGYIQFIKELSIKCEKNDIILSVDNYVPSGASAHYNRKMQANYADYVIIMGYDEHYGGSQEAGSVASIEWVEDGVVNTLAEVPADQVILGMPLYCRVWEKDANGQVSSKAYGMSAIWSYINSNNLTYTWSEACGQYYAEYSKGDSTYYIWVEDSASLEEKLKVMDNYGLAGGAFWKLGFDNESTWNTIAKYL